MKKINYLTITEQQFVDIRSQHAYQTGHIEYSVNLTPKNFKKLATTLLAIDKPLVFVLSKDEINDLPMLEILVKELGFQQLEGYLPITEVPNESLKVAKTITASALLEQTEDDYILLDVRDQSTVTIPAPEKNLVKLAIKDLADTYTQLPPNKTIYTLCGSGNSATTAASFLTKKGWQTAIVEGGSNAIQKSQQR